MADRPSESPSSVSLPLGFGDGAVAHGIRSLHGETTERASHDRSEQAFLGIIFGRRFNPQGALDLGGWPFNGDGANELAGALEG